MRTSDCCVIPRFCAAACEKWKGKIEKMFGLIVEETRFTSLFGWCRWKTNVSSVMWIEVIVESKEREKILRDRVDIRMKDSVKATKGQMKSLERDSFECVHRRISFSFSRWTKRQEKKKRKKKVKNKSEFDDAFARWRFVSPSETLMIDRSLIFSRQI